MGVYNTSEQSAKKNQGRDSPALARETAAGLRSERGAHHGSWAEDVSKRGGFGLNEERDHEPAREVEYASQDETISDIFARTAVIPFREGIKRIADAAYAVEEPA